MKPTNTGAHPPPNSIEKRLRRIESKLTQLMLHMGLNPYKKVYDGDELPEGKPEEREAKHGSQ